ncbi:TetR/AcrR family transcriptional regulator [uncultured Psychrobacter sp.]|uniref:TetR/AcrR family transcriptional regulator n=1 Tax=uncultured Psychrobacter sp. TaxID=259303 RepID=UPI00262BF935|nr:TetR/AcrR family transcriptional regulator [uncultured Psychrobacter sp.]
MTQIIDDIGDKKDGFAKASTTSPRKLAKAQTRNAIMKSALRLYSSEGSAGMSMNKVAKGAGIAQPSFYNHFASLDELQQQLSAQLKDNYLSPMRAAWITIIKDYAWLSETQFNQRCEQCLNHIFDAAFINIDLFQRLNEDRLRCGPTTKLSTKPSLELSTKPRTENQLSTSSGLSHLINEIQQEWTQIFVEGLTLSDCDFEASEVNLCVDIASAQVHELILGCHQQRYTRGQAITILCQNLNALFIRFWQKDSV